MCGLFKRLDRHVPPYLSAAAALALTGCAAFGGGSTDPAPVVDVATCWLLDVERTCPDLALPPATNAGATTPAAALAGWVVPAYTAWSECKGEAEALRGASDAWRECKRASSAEQNR